MVVDDRDAGRVRGYTDVRPARFEDRPRVLRVLEEAVDAAVVARRADAARVARCRILRAETVGEQLVEVARARVVAAGVEDRQRVVVTQVLRE